MPRPAIAVAAPQRRQRRRGRSTPAPHDAEPPVEIDGPTSASGSRRSTYRIDGGPWTAVARRRRFTRAGRRSRSTIEVRNDVLPGCRCSSIDGSHRCACRSSSSPRRIRPHAPASATSRLRVDGASARSTASARDARRADRRSRSSATRRSRRRRSTVEFTTASTIDTQTVDGRGRRTTMEVHVRAAVIALALAARDRAPRRATPSAGPRAGARGVPRRQVLRSALEQLQRPALPRRRSSPSTERSRRGVRRSSASAALETGDRDGARQRVREGARARSEQAARSADRSRTSARSRCSTTRRPTSARAHEREAERRSARPSEKERTRKLRDEPHRSYETQPVLR